jgi:hypothetical protein
MTTDPKPVELTDTERAALMHHIGGWKFERQGLANAEDAFMAEVARIVKAREAAARREALLEAADAMETEKSMPFWSVHVASLRKRAVLAEPECDEEGGR